MQNVSSYQSCSLILHPINMEIHFEFEFFLWRNSHLVSLAFRSKFLRKNLYFFGVKWLSSKKYLNLFDKKCWFFEKKLSLFSIKELILVLHFVIFHKNKLPWTCKTVIYRRFPSSVTEERANNKPYQLWERSCLASQNRKPKKKKEVRKLSWECHLCCKQWREYCVVVVHQCIM